MYDWRRQDLIDSGQVPGITSTDHAEQGAARRRIADLAVHRRAAELPEAALPCPTKAMTRRFGSSPGIPR